MKIYIISYTILYSDQNFKKICKPNLIFVYQYDIKDKYFLIKKSL